MDGVERQRSLREWLGLNAMGCCGAHWSSGPSTMSVLDEDESPLRGTTSEEESPLRQSINEEQIPLSGPMSLSAALAAERRYLAAQNLDDRGSPMGFEASRSNSGSLRGTAPGTPLKTSLMTLLTETDSDDLEIESRETALGAGARSDVTCCVCMGRKKGAAFIPCGHTFCRVCSRELWVNRGSCPLCNRPIIEILDIF